MEDKVQNVILESNEILCWIESKIENLQVNSSPRERASGACFSVALEHHYSIVLLISNDLTGSACSLIRPMLEAYIRGLWLHHKASDEEVDKLINKDILNRKFDELVKEIETVPDYDAGVLSAVKKATWKAMNSYVHCGSLQIMRRNTIDSIEPNYSDDEKVDALKGAAPMDCFLSWAWQDLQIILSSKKESLPRSLNSLTRPYLNPILPVLALVGPPNVGKSTLCNRLTRPRDAIVV